MRGASPVLGSRGSMKRLVAGCALAVGLVFAGAGVANAGEVNGKGDEVHAPDHAASECAFSGLDTDDAIENPTGNPMFDDDEAAVRGNQSPGGKDRYHGVQSFGIFMGHGVNAHLAGFNPGMACRGNMEAPPEG